MCEKKRVITFIPLLLNLYRNTFLAQSKALFILLRDSKECTKEYNVTDWTLQAMLLRLDCLFKY